MERNSKGQFIKGTNGNTWNGFGIWHDRKGYPSICIDGKDTKLHVLIWTQEHGPKPEGYDIHHKDFDKGNYELGNLELVTHSDHHKIHAGWIKIEGEWAAKPCTGCHAILPLSSFYSRKGHTPSAKCKKCHCAYTQQWSDRNPEKRREISRNYARRTAMKEVLYA